MPDELRSLSSSAWRFAIIGAANTAVTGLALAALATVLDRRLAYGVVYAIGLAFVALTAGPFVYGGRWGSKVKFAYAALYLLVFLIGLGLVTLSGRWGLPPAYSGLVVLVTAPITFFAGRVLARWVATDRLDTERTR